MQVSQAVVQLFQRGKIAADLLAQLVEDSAAVVVGTQGVAEDRDAVEADDLVEARRQVRGDARGSGAEGRGYRARGESLRGPRRGVEVALLVVRSSA